MLRGGGLDAHYLHNHAVSSVCIHASSAQPPCGYVSTSIAATEWCEASQLRKHDADAVNTGKWCDRNGKSQFQWAVSVSPALPHTGVTGAQPMLLASSCISTWMACEAVGRQLGPKRASRPQEAGNTTAAETNFHRQAAANAATRSVTCTIHMPCKVWSGPVLTKEPSVGEGVVGESQGVEVPPRSNGAGNERAASAEYARSSEWKVSSGVSGEGDDKSGAVSHTERGKPQVENRRRRHHRCRGSQR